MISLLIGFFVFLFLAALFVRVTWWVLRVLLMLITVPLMFLGFGVGFVLLPFIALPVGFLLAQRR